MKVSRRLKRGLIRSVRPTSLAQLGIEGKVLDEVIDVAVTNAKAWNMAELYSRENIAKILDFAK